MQKLTQTPEELAEELLGRHYGALDAEEQSVMHHICSPSVFDLDASEAAALEASFGDRLADRVAAIGGSWGFIIGFGVVLVGWMLINSDLLKAAGIHTFDAYPYIFLNLILSMLAAIQAPIIMMSQNRQSKKDRITARHDYEVNLRTQLKIIRLHKRFDRLLEVLERSDRKHSGS
jgi:uncharacterized membrane protein